MIIRIHKLARGLKRIRFEQQSESEETDFGTLAYRFAGTLDEADAKQLAVWLFENGYRLVHKSKNGMKWEVVKIDQDVLKVLEAIV